MTPATTYHLEVLILGMVLLFILAVLYATVKTAQRNEAKMDALLHAAGLDEVGERIDRHHGRNRFTAPTRATPLNETSAVSDDPTTRPSLDIQDDGRNEYSSYVRKLTNRDKEK